ncbi:histidinol dehydrogenase [Enteractinococcus helveticum]|uniref:Histidinol dehydrogenase n=1 Tax=Enteractinococcus helveticum TaxID=1837282 RepID=A0A1B7LZU6_9MICC|nr:histidinol dehydrogenase [Enteractinococcus helveticum]OAV61188.1 histidinol dehydrogenase [Enteractinococcus helveticum]
MLHITDLRNTTYDPATVMPRAKLEISDASVIVEPILDKVKNGGAEAVLELTEQFDKVRPASLQVPAAALDQALVELDDDVRAALEESIRRARAVHAAQLPPNSVVPLGDGAAVENHWVPIQRVGLYVPGGRAVYPSSVIMNVVPAQAAGVPGIAITSPPQADFNGLPHPTILAACKLLGIEEVYATGGAQAIAMLALGVDDADGNQVCAPVDLITGPGNVYVAAAKQAFFGQVGIDAVAGPSEILVLADETANPAWVAADLISQSEHDPLAASVLVTTSMDFAESVVAQIEAQVPGAVLEDQIREALTGQQSGALVVDTMDEAIAVTNAIATEHLEIQTSDNDAVLANITHAGAIFMGPYAPVPLGDYSAGSNHVLPTSGTARFSSGLNTVSFLRLQQRIRYDETGLQSLSEGIQTLAASEGLHAHAAAIAQRFNGM